MSRPDDAPLFRAFPLTGTRTLTTGDVTVPYHIYDGYGAFVGGTADLHAVRSLLAAEEVHPLPVGSGRALLGLWLCDFVEANLGPHTELQVSCFVTRRPAPPIAPHPLATLTTLLTRPDVDMFCHGLWNNTPAVVAYNRELLSLNARLCTSRIARTDTALTCHFAEAETGAPLLDAALHSPVRPSLRATLGLAGQLGWGRAMRLGRQPWIGVKVVNPRGVVLDTNAAAQTYNHNAANRVRFFNPARDHLHLAAAPYADLDFQPTVVQHMDGFQFVYGEPQPVTA